MRATVIVLAITLAAAGAAAQGAPTAQQRKAARSHFEQGRAFYNAGAWTDAAREYEKAYALVPLPELLFNLGQAWRMQGDKPKAIDAYRRYLDRLPDGPLAEEARNHVASLTLKIRLEEAEAARQRAAEGEAAARKQAAEAEAAARRQAAETAAIRQRAEAESRARLQGREEDEARLRRVAGEEAERMRRAKEADAAARAEAGRTGRGLRAGGWTLLVVGTVAVGFAIAAGQGVLSNYSQAQEFNTSGSWTTTDDRVWNDKYQQHVDDVRTLQKAVLGLSIGGGVLLAGGIAMLNVGVVQRSRAYKRLTERLRLVPAFGPGTGALVLAGGF